MAYTKDYQATQGVSWSHGYYRKFVQGYARIAFPLTKLLRKNKFGWNDRAQKAFEELKRKINETQVLKVPNFKKVFVGETDASNTSIEAVLSHERHPLSYFSKKLPPKLTLASAYVRELYAITQAVHKLGGYLQLKQTTKS